MKYNPFLSKSITNFQLQPAKASKLTVSSAKPITNIIIFSPRQRQNTKNNEIKTPRRSFYLL